jgi:tRNA (guanine-N7-)-methyltransferase
MRLRHIKDSDEIIGYSKYIVKDKFNCINLWNKIFKNDNSIEIEIGMGKGNFIINKAIDNPNVNYIGIEKYSSVLVYTMRKLDELEINNLKIICMDATEIDKVFNKEVSKIYLNFSDPWPKKRHAKRRLTSETFLEKYKLISKNKVNIELKTDNELLFEYSLEVFKNNGFKINEINRNHESIYKTEYEEKFLSKGKNINFVNVIKRYQ